MGKIKNFLFECQEEKKVFIFFAFSYLLVSQVSFFCSVTITIITVLISLPLILFLVRKILKERFSEIVDFLHKAKEGDLNNKVFLKTSKTVEKEYNELMESFSYTIQTFSDASTQVAGSSEELATSSQNVATSSEKLVGVSKQMGEEIQTVAQYAGDGNKISREVISELEVLSGAMKKTMEAMKHIKENSNRIGESINVITDLADQTNLLALNAAIEAARAGEQGKGFAVVADEVRKLAERSATSSKEIVGLVGASFTVVSEGGKGIEEISGEFNMLIDKINQVSGKLEKIGHSIVEQLGISDVLQDIAQTNSSSSQEIGASAEELAGQALNLSDSITKFKH